MQVAGLVPPQSELDIAVYGAGAYSDLVDVMSEDKVLGACTGPGRSRPPASGLGALAQTRRGTWRRARGMAGPACLPPAPLGSPLLIHPLPRRTGPGCADPAAAAVGRAATSGHRRGRRSHHPRKATRAALHAGNPEPRRPGGKHPAPAARRRLQRGLDPGPAPPLPGRAASVPGAVVGAGARRPERCRRRRPGALRAVCHGEGEGPGPRTARDPWERPSAAPSTLSIPVFSPPWGRARRKGNGCGVLLLRRRRR